MICEEDIIMADKEMKTLEFQGSSDRYLIRDDRFNPASKTSEMTQSVGLDASGKLWTKPGGSGGSSTSGGTVEDIYYAAAEGIPNDGTDCTSALQALVDRLYNAGGGTIVLSNGIYACKTINMRSKVSLIGQGIGATILKLLSGGSLKGHLYFPMYATGCAVSNMTLLGTDFSGWDAKATAYNTNDAGICADGCYQTS